MRCFKLSYLLPVFIICLLCSCGRDTSTTPGASSIYFAWWDGQPPDYYEPLVIAVAPLGAEFLPEQYPNVPFSQDRDEYLAEIQDCYVEGATMVHILPVAASPDTIGSLFEWTWENYKYIIDEVAEYCPGMLICADISQASIALEDSIRAYQAVSFVTPIMGRYLYQGSWQGSDSSPVVQSWVSTWQAVNLKVIPFIVSPQQADFITRSLIQTNTLQSPCHFAIAIGWQDNTASTVDVFNTVINTLPDTSKFMVVCTESNPNELMGIAIAEGYHLRVGLKDAIYWPSGTYDPINSTVFLVQKAKELANQMNRPIATTSEAAIIMDSYR